MLTAAPQDSSWNIYSVSFEADCMNGNEPGTTSPVRPSGERGEFGHSTANTPTSSTSWLWSELDKREHYPNMNSLNTIFFMVFSQMTNYTHLALTCSCSSIIL